MSRVLLAAIVALASYGALNLLLSLAAIAVWRSGIIGRGKTAAARAREIFVLRGIPAAGSALVVTAVVVPAFAAYEPPGAREFPGPVLSLFAVVAAGLLLASTAVALRNLFVTWRFNRAWKATAKKLDVDRSVGVPAYAFDSAMPIVALVGVWAPRLVAARRVLDLCSRDELARIIAHERGHLDARDNLKRWLITCAPDVVRWTPAHAAMASAWADAAEDCADDAATGGGDAARLDLAALLVKIGRLTPAPAWTAATFSPFVEIDGLERRVRRLLSDDAGVLESRVRPIVPMIALAVAALAALAAFDGATLKQAYDLLEAAVHLGR